MTEAKPPAPVPWDQPATLIDLDGTAPLIAALADCVHHFAALNTAAKADARILLTQPLPRLTRRTRTWLLGPEEIAALGEPPRQNRANSYFPDVR